MDGGNNQIHNAAGPDLSRYRVHLAPLSLPPEREDEILLSIWRIMGSFVDRAWNDDPVQMLDLKDENRNLSQELQSDAAGPRGRDNR